jgi:hypothetical protein
MCAFPAKLLVDDGRVFIVGVHLSERFRRRRAPHEHAAVSPVAAAKSVLARPVEITVGLARR